MIRIASKTAVAAVLVLACGCAGADEGPSAPGTFPSESYATLLSDGGELSITVWTAPEQPPPRGEIAVKLAVADAASGAPVAGLALDVVPWMPVMGHGTSVVPTVTSDGKGTYLIEHVNLFMPGRWELRTHFKDDVDDRASPIFDVP